MSKHEISPESRKYIDSMSPDQRKIASAMRNALLAACPELEEAIKWRRLTFTKEGNWDHWIFAIGASKKSVALYFHKGALLDDPAGFLQGSGKYTRFIPGDAFQELDSQAFKELLGEAVSRQTDMLEE